MLSQSINSIFDQLDAPAQFNTPIVNCTRKVISKDQDIMNIDMLLDINDPSTTIKVSIGGDHKHLGFDSHSDHQTLTIQDCDHGTPANNIERWRSRFRNATIRAINGEIIDTAAQFKQQIKALQASKVPECTSLLLMKILETSIQPKASCKCILTNYKQ